MEDHFDDGTHDTGHASQHNEDEPIELPNPHQDVSSGKFEEATNPSIELTDDQESKQLSKTEEQTTMTDSPTLDQQDRNVMWENRLQKHTDALDNPQMPAYDTILRELGAAPDGLAGDLNDRINALEQRTREMQAAEREVAEQEAWTVIRNKELLPDSKAGQLKALLESRLGAFDPDLEEWLRSLSDPQWNDAKRGAYQEYLEHHINSDRKNDYLWLKDQRDLMSTIGGRGPALENLREQILDLISEILRRENRIQSVEQTGSFMDAIADLTLKVANGEVGYEINPVSGEPRVDADGNYSTYDPAVRRNETETKYAQWAIKNGTEQFNAATDLLIEDWINGMQRFKAGRDISLIDNDLRKGIIGMDPTRRGQAGYEVVSERIKTSQVIPPRIEALPSADERTRFNTVLNALDEALRLIHQVATYNNSNSLAELYEYVVPYYQHPSLDTELERLEKRERKRLEDALEDLQQTAAETRDDAAISDLEDALEKSPFNLRVAPTDRRDYIESLRTDLGTLARETKNAKRRFTEVQGLLDNIEYAINNDDLQSAANRVDDIRTRLDADESSLTPRQHSRFTSLEAKLASRQGVSQIYQETRKRYNAALGQLEAKPVWNAVLQFSEETYKHPSPTGDDPNYYDGRKMYLHALARYSYLRALDEPYMDPENKRQAFHNRAKQALVELEQALALLGNSSLGDANELRELIKNDEAAIERVKETKKDIIEAFNNARTLYDGIDYYTADFIKAYQQIEGFESATDTDSSAAEYLEQIGKDWIAATDTALHDFINTATSPSDANERARQLTILQENIEYFENHGYRPRQNLLADFRRLSIDVKQVNYLSLHTQGEPQRNGAFDLPMGTDGYIEWIILLQKRSDTTKQRPLLAEVYAYGLLSYINNGDRYVSSDLSYMSSEPTPTSNNTNQFIDTLRQVLETERYPNLPNELIDAVTSADKLLLYDAIMWLYTTEILELHADNATNETSIKRFNTDIEAYKRRLVASAKTAAAAELNKLWNTWLSATKAYLTSDMNEALAKIDELLRLPSTELQAGDNTGWLRRRQLIIQEESHRLRQNVSTRVNNELANASIDGQNAENLARTIEYAFIERKLNPSSAQADYVIDQINNQLTPILDFYVGAAQGVLQNTLPVDIDRAVEEIAALVAKVDLIARGLRDDGQRRIQDQLARFEALAGNMRALYNQLDTVARHYAEARLRLYNILRNEAGVNYPTSFRWDFFKLKYDELDAAIRKVLQQGQEFFNVPGEITVIGWFTTLQGLYDGIQDQLEIVKQSHKRITDAVNRQGDFASANRVDSPQNRYQQALLSLDNIERAINTIADGIRTEGESVFVGYDPIDFTLPDEFLVTGLPQSISVPQSASSQNINLRQLRGIHQHREILQKLKQQSQVWESWVKRINELYEKAEDEHEQLSRWQDHFIRLRDTALIQNNEWVDVRQIRYAYNDLERLHNAKPFIRTPTFGDLGASADQVEQLAKASTRVVALSTFKQILDEISQLAARPPANNVPEDLREHYEGNLRNILNRPFFINSFDNSPQRLHQHIEELTAELRDFLALLTKDYDRVNDYCGAIHRDIVNARNEINDMQGGWINRGNRQALIQGLQEDIARYERYLDALTANVQPTNKG